MTRSALHDLEQRPQRYWNVDGIPEPVMGGLWLLWEGAFLIGQALPRGWGAVVYWLTVPVVLALSGFAGRWLVTRIKERLTYPRTGYVDYPAPARRTRVIAAVLAIAGAATMVGFAASAERLAAPAVGVVICLMFLVMSLRQRAPHLLVLAAASVGAVRLRRYLKANPS